MSIDEVRYQIFVSSTFKDLKEEREKVLQAILELKAFPAGMELFPSADEEQFEFIKREIDSSDYYIVIVAGRYGSMGQDGTSYTEKEYDYAVQNNKPVLRFLHYDTQKLAGEKLEPSDSGKEKLKAFRAKVQSSRLCKEYESPDDLKSKVLTSLVSQFNLKPMRGWVRAGQTPRVDLENISRLQQRIIKLESENQLLRESASDPSAVLATGREDVFWEVDLKDVRIGNTQSPQASFTVETTWDNLLISIFPGTTSDATIDHVRTALTELIIGYFPESSEFSTWKRELAMNLAGKRTFSTNWKSVNEILAAVQIQFSGLGLVQEEAETRYIHTTGGQMSPQTVRVWKLTNKGKLHLALIAGYKKGE